MPVQRENERSGAWMSLQTVVIMKIVDTKYLPEFIQMPQCYGIEQEIEPQEQARNRDILLRLDGIYGMIPVF